MIQQKSYLHARNVEVGQVALATNIQTSPLIHQPTTAAQSIPALFNMIKTNNLFK